MAAISVGVFIAVMRWPKKRCLLELSKAERAADMAWPVQRALREERMLDASIAALQVVMDDLEGARIGIVDACPDPSVSWCSSELIRDAFVG